MSKGTPCDQKNTKPHTHESLKLTFYWHITVLLEEGIRFNYKIYTTKRNLPCVDISALPHRHLQQQQKNIL